MYEIDSGQLSQKQYEIIRELSSATNTPDDEFTARLFPIEPQEHLHNTEVKKCCVAGRAFPQDE